MQTDQKQVTPVLEPLQAVGHEYLSNFESCHENLPFKDHHSDRSPRLGKNTQCQSALQGIWLHPCGGQLGVRNTSYVWRAAPHQQAPIRVSQQQARVGYAGFARLGLINWLAAGLVALVLSTSYLLDGPSEIDAIQATADSKQDAINTAAIKASNTTARGQKDHKTVVAGVQP